MFQSNLQLDLRRRDFTLNTLAIAVDEGGRYPIIDFFGGFDDISRRRIRVLHTLSFIDDPTRILRAVRFSQRLDFEIEPNTLDLLKTSVPLLGRLTGKRIRHEITLLLQEPEPEYCIARLQSLDIPAAIHPDFILVDEIRPTFVQARELLAAAGPDAADVTVVELYWLVMLLSASRDRSVQVAEHLLFGHPVIQTLEAAAKLLSQVTPDERRSDGQWTTLLEPFDSPTLMSAALLQAAPVRTGSTLSDRMATYRTTDKRQRPEAARHTCRADLPYYPDICA